MIHENIRRARLAKGVSQAELAAQLHVVRQTISKWEKGLSVPDADMLLRLAELLDVPVEALLGVAVRDDSTEALVRLNEALAEKEAAEKRRGQAEKVRGAILLMCFAAMLVALHAGEGLASVALIFGCLLAAVIVLYRNLALLTRENSRMGALKVTTIFSGVAIVATAAITLLDLSAVLRLGEDGEQALAVALICAVMIFAGHISSRLPFNRHTGLRLPWTVRDEETWNVAHRIIGWISLPLALLYLAALRTLGSFDAITAAAMLLWIGIPALLSLAFWWKKFRGKCDP